MTGLTNYTANGLLNYITGQTPEPTLPAVWLALFTVVGTDAGTGFTEVSGGSYARVQVAGAVAATAAFTTASPNITMTTNPGWVLPGMSVYDTTKTPAPGALVGTVLTYSGTALVLTANSLIASQGTTDNISFSAFGQSSGTGPSTLTNGAALAFVTSTANWGTLIAFGLYDAVTVGNLLSWDFLGNFAWLPFECPTASSLLTVKGNGYSSNDPVVLTAEYGGTFPTLSTGTFTTYTVNFVATPATDTVNLDTTTGPATPIVTTASGSGMIRKIVQQSLPSGVTATFAASTLTITAA
jgi:hypothetical protein